MRQNIYKGLTLALLALFSMAASAQVINRFAGLPDSAGHSGDGGYATRALMNQPIALAKDSVGNIYIGEGNGDVIRKVDHNGIISTIAGTGTYGHTGDNGPASVATFNGPDGIIFDRFGNMIIADFGSNVIRKIDRQGTITKIAGTDSMGYTGDGGPATNATFHYPRDVKYDTKGNLYICDWLNHAIRKIDTAGIITTFAGTGVAGYSGNNGPASAARINLPYRGAIDSAGNYYFIDGNNNCVRKVDGLGNITTVVGTDTAGFRGDGGLATAALMSMPTALAFDHAGDLYVADRGNGRIRRVDRVTGIITTVVGNGTSIESGDGGLPTAAGINKPFDILFDDSNYLYIADINGNTVRKANPEPLSVIHTGISDFLNLNASMVLYPNPNSGLFKVKGTVHAADGDATIEVTNMLGQTIYTANTAIRNGMVDTQMQIDNSQPSGLYLLHLTTSASQITTLRFVIE